MAEITVNINIGDSEEPELKKVTKKSKNGKETILKLPDTVETAPQAAPAGNDILNMLGV